ncbi:SO2930 family diheme c-type cytochrome [Bermanella sp. R86510]|uniref:SO2930 family diheme c-type cytochrome n=1 Tax=unclassified Bermanella TaxID=2627862 RepID=UPI0037CA9F3D
MKLLHHAKPMAWLSVIVVSSLLSACGGGADDSNSTNSDQWQIARQDVTITGTNPAVCNTQTSEVNWDALLEANCHNLSDYNLFKNPSDPTQDPQTPGIPYELNTQLFTDYASKYRFVFVPDGKAAQFSDHEVMEFPIGSVLVKTFSIPENTSDLLGNEHVVETRLLIHRESGWEAVPYYWSSEDDAQYLSYGATIPASTTHKGKELTFNYGVPTKNECTNCHAIQPIRDEKKYPDDERVSIFKPIGPKARFLNWDYDYGSGEIKNQLTKWEEAGILTGVPTNKESIEKAVKFHNNTDIPNLTSDELDLAARSYLDINCAHCHRSELTLQEPDYSGPAGDSGLRLEFNRNFDTDKLSFGICKKAVASGEPGYPLDIIPGYADKSFLLYRMDILGGKMMPELGRDTIHSEGVELIKAWINNMTPNNCGLDL